MRVLLDECLPRQLGRHLGEHVWSTVPKEGLSGIKNGALLAAISGKWDVLLTSDSNLPWQQSLRGKDVAVLVIRAYSNRKDDLIPWMPQVLQALAIVKKGEAVETGDPSMIGK